MCSPVFGKCVILSSGSSLATLTEVYRGTWQSYRDNSALSLGRNHLLLNTL